MMDAVEFLKTKNRMCKTYLRTKTSKCDGCPFDEEAGAMCSSWCFEHMAEAVAIVERWAEQHPVKTRQSEFLKQWPKALVNDDGVLSLCPNEITPRYRAEHGGCVNTTILCSDCRREFWLKEVE